MQNRRNINQTQKISQMMKKKLKVRMKLIQSRERKKTQMKYVKKKWTNEEDQKEAEKTDIVQNEEDVKNDEKPEENKSETDNVDETDQMANEENTNEIHKNEMGNEDDEKEIEKTDIVQR